jgi:hypothetical protein
LTGTTTVAEPPAVADAPSPPPVEPAAGGLADVLHLPRQGDGRRRANR